MAALNRESTYFVCFDIQGLLFFRCGWSRFDGDAKNKVIAIGWMTLDKTAINPKYLEYLIIMVNLGNSYSYWDIVKRISLAYLLFSDSFIISKSLV